MIIKIYFINIYDKNIINNSNDSVLIQIFTENNLQLINEVTPIKYNITNNIINEKNYYFEINDQIDITSLTENNFILNLSSSYTYVYAYYGLDTTKSIIIFNSICYYPLIFMGLPNMIDDITIKINYLYNTVVNINSNDLNIGNPDGPRSSLTVFDSSGNELINLYNNYFGYKNYNSNSLIISGSIFEINILEISDQINLNNYELFQIEDSFYLNNNTNIYFYNTSNQFAYITYLNQFNYYDNKPIPENYDNIIMLIDYIDTSGNIYSEMDLPSTTPTFYEIDSSGNKIDVELDINVPSVYSVVLSLNLQTFNSLNVPSTETNNYYNNLFFYNYINSNYFVKSISMFDYDYNKYFINNETILYPKTDPKLFNIGSFDSDLYNQIISNDTNLEVPIILELNYSYLFINIDLIKLIKLINFNSENNYINRFTKSNDINIITLIQYLLGYYVKTYNVYRINNIFKFNNSYDKNIYLQSNYIYTVDDNNVLPQNILNNKLKKIINLKNNIMNCILCKIIFLFYDGSIYSLTSKLFLDNYNIEIYHKNYDFENSSSNTNKQNLLNMLLYLATFSYGIKLIFYNDLSSQPSISSFFNYNLKTNPYYLFNEINLSRKLNDFFINFNINSDANNFINNNLKFNININKDYYILFLYSDKNSLSSYNELIFTYAQYTFKIFKINSPNGNIDEQTDIFYISFQNLKELNIFMLYISTGVFNINPEYILEYFNFTSSIVFYNYYNINNFWVLSSVDPPAVPYNDSSVLDKNQISFSISKLYINQIYLYGENLINIIS